MEILKPEELKEKFSDPWVAPYEKVLTMVDGNKVEIVEYHPCISGSHWLLHQYKNNSELIDDAYRDGNKHVYSCHTGSAPLDLQASFNAAGIDEIQVVGDEVKVTHAGLAGAGVGAGMCRGMGKGVKYIELIKSGGGSKEGRATVVTPKLEKVVIGVDDTDVKDAGATWTMAHNLGVELASEGYEYLDHIIVQLYPHNPHKTQNCVSIALTFAVESEKKDALVNRVIEILKRDTLSDKTAIAVLEGLEIPEKLREYAMATKTGMMDVETADEINELEPKPEYEKIIKDPYVLEFLDLPANEHFYESDLEQALIDHLQKFLLELGKGYSFVARQKHFDIDGRHFYIDLVFYNYILKCFVLVDLKIGDLTHQDIGQMQMYVNYYTRELMNEGDNPPIGIVLCADKSDTLVEYTLPEDNKQIFAANYLPYMPTKEELKKELNLDDFQKSE